MKIVSKDNIQYVLVIIFVDFTFGYFYVFEDLLADCWVIAVSYVVAAEVGYVLR